MNNIVATDQDNTFPSPPGNASATNLGRVSGTMPHLSVRQVTIGIGRHKVVRPLRGFCRRQNRILSQGTRENGRRETGLARKGRPTNLPADAFGMRMTSRFMTAKDIVVVGDNISPLKNKNALPRLKEENPIPTTQLQLVKMRTIIGVG